MLHCVAIGDPEPAVQWDKNNKMLTIDENEQRLKVRHALAGSAFHSFSLLPVCVAYWSPLTIAVCTQEDQGSTLIVRALVSPFVVMAIRQVLMTS